MIKLAKNIFSMFALLSIVLLCNGQAKAATVYNEVEPNDYMDQAATITRNQQTAAQVAAGNLNNKYSVSGKLSNIDDVDWYKVNLYSNQDNIWDFAFTNVASGGALLEVYDSNGLLVGNNAFNYTLNSERTFRVTVPSTGIYYLKITSTSTDTTKYYGFSIGTPIYLLSSYVENYPSMTLNANSTWAQALILSDTITIPKDAIAYRVVLDGGTLASTSTREIKNASNSTWLVTSSSPWQINTPVTNINRVRQNWYIQYNAKNKATTFAPKVTFWYAYPRMPLGEQY